MPIVPGLINMKQVFQSNFDFRLKMKGQPIEDARGYLDAFEEQLSKILEELFDKAVVFDQTSDESKCLYCDFKGMCER